MSHNKEPTIKEGPRKSRRWTEAQKQRFRDLVAHWDQRNATKFFAQVAKKLSVEFADEDFEPNVAACKYQWRSLLGPPRSFSAAWTREMDRRLVERRDYLRTIAGSILWEWVADDLTREFFGLKFSPEDCEKRYSELFPTHQPQPPGAGSVSSSTTAPVLTSQHETTTPGPSHHPADAPSETEDYTSPRALEPHLIESRPSDPFAPGNMRRDAYPKYIRPNKYQSTSGHVSPSNAGTYELHEPRTQEDGQSTSNLVQSCQDLLSSLGMSPPSSEDSMLLKCNPSATETGIARY